MITTTQPKPGARATRLGNPAHQNAPERLRASSIQRPFVPELERQGPDIFEGLFGRLLGRLGR
jgi:hypothetical protein